MELEPCPICYKQVSWEKIGNEHTKKQSIEISCKDCNLKMLQSILTRSNILTFEELKKITIKKWNSRGH